MPKWFYFTVLAIALLTLAVGGWVVEGNQVRNEAVGAPRAPAGLERGERWRT